MAVGVVLLLVLAGALAVRVVGGAGADAGQEDAGSRRVLAIVGDSITHSAAADLAAEADRAGWSAAVDATPGAITPDKQGAARLLAADRPAVAVIHLGTNDWMCVYQNVAGPDGCRIAPYTEGDVDREVTSMARTFDASGACVVGVVPYLDQSLAAIWDRLRAEGTVTVVADWRGEATAQRAAWLADEMGHLTPEGQAAYARFVLDAARACPDGSLDRE